MIALLLIGAAVPASPDAAPAPPIAAQKKVVVDAIRNCAVAGPGEIAVCARDRGIAEGYRMPKLDPRFAAKTLRPSGRGEIASEGPGATGTGSCTPGGAGGFTGCSLQDYRQWGAWKAQEKADGRAFPW